MTSDDYVRASDIAALTGIPEPEVQEILKEYGSGLHVRSVGRVRLYAPRAVDVVRKHAGTRPVPAPRPPRREPAAEPPRRVPRNEGVMEVRRLRDLLARQELTISRLADELARQETRIEALEAARDAHEHDLALHGEQIRVTGDWVEYFDGAMDACREEIRRTWWDRLRGRR